MKGAHGPAEGIPYFWGLGTLEEARRTFGERMGHHGTDCTHQVSDYDHHVNVCLSECFPYGTDGDTGARASGAPRAAAPVRIDERYYRQWDVSENVIAKSAFA